MLEPRDVHAHLDALAESLEEARAATQTVEEGDPSAMDALRAAVDELAVQVAALKAAVAGAPLG